MFIVIALFFLRNIPFEASVVLTGFAIRTYLALVRHARVQLERARTDLGSGNFDAGAFIRRNAFNLSLMARMGSSLTRRVSTAAVIQGECIVKRLKKSRKGAVTATFHFGPWELAAEVFSSRGYRLGALVGRQKTGFFDRYLAALRRRSGLEVFHRLEQARAALARGTFVAAFMDKTRRARRGAWSLPYNDYNISVIPQTLAKLTEKELVPFMCYFDGGKLNIHIGKPSQHPRDFFAPFFRSAPCEWLVWGD